MVFSSHPTPANEDLSDDEDEVEEEPSHLTCARCRCVYPSDDFETCTDLACRLVICSYCRIECVCKRVFCSRHVEDDVDNSYFSWCDLCDDVLCEDCTETCGIDGCDRILCNECVCTHNPQNEE